MQFIKQFTEPSKLHEQLFVGYCWANPVLYEKFKPHKITRDTFTETIWYFYFQLGKDMYTNGIRTFDDVTVYSFVETRPQPKGKKSFMDWYEEYGGYETVEELIGECKRDKQNEDFHLSEIQKYEALRNFQKSGLINVADDELVDALVHMTLKEAQMFVQYQAKKAFAHVNSGEVVEHNLIDNLEETIHRLNEGESLGLPFHNASRLNRKIKGWKLGTQMYLVLSSGVGKTSFGTEKALLSLIENNEKGLVFANEEGIFKFRTLLLATVCSRVLRKPIPRDVLSSGNFNEETLAKLNEAKDWLYEHRRDMLIFCELKKYRIEDVVSRIEMYRPLGYSHVFFDTFKPDLSNKETSRWESFSESAQILYDCVKEDSNNVAMLATVQLKIGKEFRYLDMDSIGKSKEIVEVAGVVLIGRMMYADEYPEGKNELKVYDWRPPEENQFEDKWWKKDIKIEKDKKYMILFIAKNREGSVDEQIVYEVNYSMNSWVEIGYCQVPRNSNFAG